MSPFFSREIKEGNLSPKEVYDLALKPGVEWKPDYFNFCYGRIGHLDIEMQPIDINPENSIGVDIYVKIKSQDRYQEIGFARVLNENADCVSNGTEIRDNQAMSFFKRIKEDCLIRYHEGECSIKEDAIAQARRYLLEDKV